MLCILINSLLPFVLTDTVYLSHWQASKEHMSLASMVDKSVSTIWLFIFTVTLYSFAQPDSASTSSPYNIHQKSMWYNLLGVIFYSVI